MIDESTVYPVCTEKNYVPILARQSGLVFSKDFFCGYRPERIRLGDKVHRLSDIVKVTSGSTEAASDYVDALYGLIIEVGTG